MSPFKWLGDKVIRWLVHERESAGTPFCDFNRLSFEIRPCDVLLVEGRSRVSEVIKNLTQSIWTHSALYIGRLHDIQDPQLREHIARFHHGDPDVQLIIEPLLGEGTVAAAGTPRELAPALAESGVTLPFATAVALDLAASGDEVTIPLSAEEAEVEPP